MSTVEISGGDVVGDTLSASILAPATPGLSPRFPKDLDWRFVILDRATFETLTFLDKIAFNRTLYYELNQTAYAAGDVSSDNPEVKILHTDGDPFLSFNDRFLIGLRREGAGSGGRPGYLDPTAPWVPRFAGLISQVQRQAQSDQGVSHYTAYDPLQYWASRPVVNSVGLLPKTDGIPKFNTPGSQILVDLLADSLAAHGSLYVDFGQTPFYTGTIETTAPVDIIIRGGGASLADAVKQLTDTSTLDVILTPVYDLNRPGIIAELSIFGKAGTYQNEAIFAWNMPSRSLAGLDLLHDGASMGNKAEPWLPSANTFLTSVQDSPSVSFYGQWWILNQSFGGSIGDSTNAVTASAVERLLALAQVELQKAGKATLTIDPAPERSPLLFQEYGLGDLVPIYASDDFGEAINPGMNSGGFWSNPQRVIAIPLTLSDEGVETISGMLMTYYPALPSAIPPRTEAIMVSLAAAAGRLTTRATTYFRTHP